MSHPTRPFFNNHGIAARSAIGVTAVLSALIVICRASASAEDAPAAPVFAPPAESAIPAGPDGDAIRRGRAIFTQTRTNATSYVGNGLVCSNCHLDAGRTANAAPMWAAWVSYPAFRAKNGRVNTMEDRISDCFLYSMNAPASRAKVPPPPGDPIYRDLEMYFAWLATGARTGEHMAGRGYLKLAPTALGHDPARGRQVFAAKCAACHGPRGEGQPLADGSYVFPPLAGPAAYNWGAGMTSVAILAGFVKANMPLGLGYSLNDQDAWDVAAFVDSRDRPRDPRQTGSIQDAHNRYHASGDYYGQVVE